MNAQPSKYLAYVEWFSKLLAAAESQLPLYQIEKLYYKGNRVASIIPLANITRSIHLFPKFDTPAAKSWTSNTVLDQCNTFYVNSFSDRHAFH